MVLTINERKEQRERLLKELYEQYFEVGGGALHLTKDDLRNDRDKDLAYQYLSEKGLIEVDTQGNHIYLKPSVHGIDIVEN